MTEKIPNKHNPFCILIPILLVLVRADTCLIHPFSSSKQFSHNNIKEMYYKIHDFFLNSVTHHILHGHIEEGWKKQSQFFIMPRIFSLMILVLTPLENSN